MSFLKKQIMKSNFYVYKNYFSLLKIKMKFNKKKIKQKHNSCFFNKRTRSFIRFFGLNRMSLKTFFSSENLPGLIKSSW